MKFLFIICVMFVLSACSKHYHPLDASKKAKMVLEQISENQKCASYREELSNSSVEDDGIDDIYQRAMRAQCIKKDI